MDAGPRVLIDVQLGSDSCFGVVRMTEFDLAARQACLDLAEAFSLEASLPEPSPGAQSIGIEVEVPWSSYFPGLWEEYGLDQRKVSALGPDELTELGRRCTELELDLLPRLRKTVECGVPRGNDRYWEFSLNPAHDTGLLVEQVRLLSAAGVLPRERKHSLHVTVGDMPRCEDLYYLCTLLEVEFVDPQRIRDGINQTRSAIHTGWARKGLAGIFEKGASDLKGGATRAAEIRMLQLPQDDAGFASLMARVQWGVNAIADCRAGRDTLAAAMWRITLARTKKMLADQGLPLENWSRGGQNYEIWDRFVEAMPRLRLALAPARTLIESVCLEGRFAIEPTSVDDQPNTHIRPYRE